MSVAPQTVSEIKEEDIQAVMEALAAGNTPAEAAGIGQDQLEALYSLAHHLYTVGKYKDAETAFQALCLYDYSDPRFWMGLGASMQAEGKYEMAAQVYSMAGLNTGLKDPAPFYYAGLCFLKLGDLESAEGTWQAIDVMGEDGNAEHRGIKDKVSNMLEALRKSKKEG